LSAAFDKLKFVVRRGFDLSDDIPSAVLHRHRRKLGQIIGRQHSEPFQQLDRDDRSSSAIVSVFYF
jgi:hypothetical protein